MKIEDAWPCLKQIADGSLTIKNFEKIYQLYYRFTEYHTDPKEWYKMKIHWVIHRSWNYKGEHNKPMYEACVQEEGKHGSWFLWNAEYRGLKELVMVEKFDCLGEGI